MPHREALSTTSSAATTPDLCRQQSQQSKYAKAALMSNLSREYNLTENNEPDEVQPPSGNGALPLPADGPAVTSAPREAKASTTNERVPQASTTSRRYTYGRVPATNGVGVALSDTPIPSIPASPKTAALRPAIPSKQPSGNSTPRVRPTTLDIPGLTKSKVSPDGRIAKRDVGSKLVIVMVGLPARGKSYITKKLARYLNWLQHDTRIFNVGEKRRIVAHGDHHSHDGKAHTRTQSEDARIAANIMLNRDVTTDIPTFNLPEPESPEASRNNSLQNLPSGMVSPVGAGQLANNKIEEEEMDQSASFFDPDNKKAAAIREQCAVETLDELLQYILEDGGAVGILDATNSTLARRKLVMEHIREKAGQEINVLFVESVCEDETLLEANMRLKLSGPDYKDKDPVASLADFKKRVEIYEKAYVPLGEYEERNNMPYVRMIDVGRKVISHQIRGFLSAQAVYYLLNFNLAPRTIWITRHGESVDNVLGKIGGDSELSPAGRQYARDLTAFITAQAQEWEVRQQDKALHTHFPPLPGDHTPPNPHFQPEGTDGLGSQRNFCIWSSMLKRSVQSAEYFDDEEFDVKQMRMLDELNAGLMEGMTYDEIRNKYADEFELRRQDKLAYRYPGPGGEGYLDVINRLRPVIVELERMTDHCLLLTHRSVARVLLAYFMGLRRDQVADLDCPLGMLYSLEPKPYGVEFRAFRYNMSTGTFDHLPDFELRKAVHPHDGADVV